MTSLAVSYYREVVEHALLEDRARADITSDAIVPANRLARGVFLAKQSCVLAGLDVAAETFRQVDPALTFEPIARDGDACPAGARLAGVDGPARALLAAERTALNFLQHLSGIATMTRHFVDAAAGRITILDTRKTLPNLRQLEKYAVRCGGGTNHRFGLHDGVLIKDNHIRIAGGIAEAVRRVRERHYPLPVEVETQNLRQVAEALDAGADIIMLDNLSDAEMKDAVALIGGRARVEVSGGVTFDRLPAIAALGADCVSAGALTHSAPAADISLEIDLG
jgi:nicotinate-nucleotide pyrophosphorylase (carboxylating)